MERARSAASGSAPEAVTGAEGGASLAPSAASCCANTPSAFPIWPLKFAPDFSRGIFSLILSGRIGIISETGQVIRGMGIGEILGEIGVTSPQNKRSATAKAVQATELFEWNIEIIQQHLPEVMKRLKDLAWKNASNYY